jgi:predicted amidohydrolase
MLAESSPRRNSVVLLPEMFATGFSMNVPAIAESDSGPTHSFLAETARDFGIFIAAGVVTTAADGRGRNECVIFSPEGKLAARYCKMHPFSFSGESRYYTAGDKVEFIDIERFRAAPFICYDLRFPEVFRSAVLGGVHLFCVIANWPAAREAHWIALLKARAIENQAYVAAVNRCGEDPNLNYPGRSMIIDPWGEVIADAGSRECLINAELDLESLVKYREEFPVLKDVHEKSS